MLAWSDGVLVVSAQLVLSFPRNSFLSPGACVWVFAVWACGPSRSLTFLFLYIRLLTYQESTVTRPCLLQ